MSLPERKWGRKGAISPWRTSKKKEGSVFGKNPPALVQGT